MCQTLWLNKVEIETIGELRKVMPNIIRHELYEELPSDDCCLCGVDLVATGNAHGFNVKISPDFMFYDAEPKQESK